MNFHYDSKNSNLYHEGSEGRYILTEYTSGWEAKFVPHTSILGDPTHFLSEAIDECKKHRDRKLCSPLKQSTEQ